MPASHCARGCMEAGVRKASKEETAGGVCAGGGVQRLLGRQRRQKKKPGTGRALRFSQNRLTYPSALLDCSVGFLFAARTLRSAGRPTASPTACPKDSSSELPSEC